MTARAFTLFGTLIVLIFLIGLWQGTANVLLLSVTSLAYALIALGLNIQFGYGGLFNLAVMGMLMLGAMATTLISMPINMSFWDSDGPYLLLRAIGAAIAGGVLVFAVRWGLKRLGVGGTFTFWITLLAWLFAYIFYRTQIDPAALYIEQKAGWVGGLGLPVWLGWAAGAVFAALGALVIGRVSLGLRSDYLAIATIGMSEIIRAFVKNMDWLTRGTLTVTPVPWPVPTPQYFQELGADTTASFVYARGGFLLVLLVLVAVVLFGIERVYRGPWGRMMRAIRDNHIAAASMGKDVTRRQLELFVLGSALMGLGGAVLASFSRLFDPAGYIPINHTFLIWVMVIVGGAGNSFGALFGAVFIYFVWMMSDPVSHTIFEWVNSLSLSIGWPAIPEIDARSSQMRVFVLGLVITLALRFAPRGLIPEIIRRER
ncbi:MAG TPA: branched-chain amino acid ABC transporter permease [Devosia sp.]|nr:branched-chain amino acid ABC transporter permease [Devosia sp.]